MGPVFARIVVDAPRERIFSLLVDLTRRPAFCDHFQRDYRLERLEATGVGAGARFRIEAPRDHHWADSSIDEVEAPHLVRERGSGGPLNRVRTQTVWEILESSGSSSTVEVAFWTEPEHPIDQVRDLLGSRRWYRKQLRKALERLRDAAESDPAQVSRVAVAGG